MEKQTAASLVGCKTVFKSDMIFANINGVDHYYWQNGDTCSVIGYLHLPEKSPVLLCTVNDGFDFHEIELPDVEMCIDLDAVAFPATELATAVRRHVSLVQ